jgi:hypothetical protein
MANITQIIQAIDQYLEKKHLEKTTPVEISPILEEAGILNNSKDRPGLPLRRILRAGKIPHAYQIRSNWYIPHSKKATNTALFNKPTSGFDKGASSGYNQIITQDKVDSVPAQSVQIHKLESIAKTVIQVLCGDTRELPKYTFEYKPEWLLSYPTPELIEQYPVLNKVYSELNDGHYSLLERLSIVDNRKLNQKQALDIWIGPPFNVAVEFDEKQHFNQYRLLTLRHYEGIPVGFPVDYYLKLNRDAFIKPGTSGFTQLKSLDPLFPEMMSGVGQDNRVRQRAFRDMLKDLLPIFHGYRPTIRIPYQITAKKISDFGETELANVKEYLLNNIESTPR